MAKMKKHRRFTRLFTAGALALGTCTLILTGCRTAHVYEPSYRDAFPPPEGEIIRLSKEDQTFSKALAYFSTAHLHELNQQFDEALIYYRLALAHDPNHANTYLRVALNLIRQNKTDDAIEVLLQLAERRPNDAQPLLWLGSAYRHKRDFTAAIATYETALKRAPDNAGIYVQLVDLLIQQGREQDAIDLLIEGADKADDPLNLYRILAEMYMRQAGLSTATADTQRYLERSIATFRQALEIDPNDVSMLTTMGELLLRSRQFEEAVDVYERIDTLQPDDLAVKERLAYTYELVGRLDEAVRALEEMSALQPTNARIFLALGALYERLDQIENAILNYQLASRLGRPDPAPYLKLAVLQMEDEPEVAVTALREGLEYLPDNPRILEMLGYVLFNKGDYAGAINVFRRAEAEWLLLDDAITPNFFLYLGLSYYFNNQPDDVPDLLWRAMQGNPDALEAFTHFVFQDEDEERIDQAIPIFNALREKKPDDAALLTMLAYVHSFRKEYADAMRVFAEVYDLAHGTEDESLVLNPRFYFWYAAAHEREGMHERAEELFYTCLELDPSNAEAYNYLAYMWAEKGVNLDKATEYVLIALDARPDSGAFIDTLGWIYYQQGRYEEAYTEIKRAADIIPDDPTILDHLGDIYLKLDEPEKAMAKWKRAYIIDPENEDVSRKLIEYGVDLEPLREAPDAHGGPDEIDATPQEEQPEEDEAALNHNDEAAAPSVEP